MKKLFIAALLLTVSFNSFSQEGISIHAGLATPTGNFANEDSYKDDASGATSGFNIGVEYRHKLTESGLFVFASGDYMNNGVTDKVKQSTSIPDMDMTYPKYSNIPIIGGLGLELSTGKTVHLFASAGLGINYFSMSDITAKYYNQTVTMAFSTSDDLAYKFSAGLIFNKRYILAINYFGLGSHELTATTTAPDGSKTKSTIPALNVSIVTTTFAVRL